MTYIILSRFHSKLLFWKYSKLYIYFAIHEYLPCQILLFALSSDISNVLVWTREEFYIALDDAHHNGAAEFHLVARQHSACSGLFSRTPRGPARVPTSLPRCGPVSSERVSHLGRMNAYKREKILNLKHKFTMTARVAKKTPRRIWRSARHTRTRRDWLRPRIDSDWSVNTQWFVVEPPANAGEGRLLLLRLGFSKPELDFFACINPSP